MIEQLQGLLPALTWGSVGITVAAILTLVVFSYLVGDNPLYKIAQHVLVGAALGYALVVAYNQVLVRRLATPLAESPQDNWPLLVPTALGLFLFARAGRQFGWLANWGIAPVIGVGAVLALTGALVGSLVPQVEATAVPLVGGTGGAADLVGRLILVVGVVCTLCYFFFTARHGVSGAVAGRAGSVGKWVMMVAFGALFASIAAGRVSLLVSRVYFLLGDWLGLIGR